MEAAMGKITTMIKSKLHGLKDKAKKEGMKNVMKYKDKLPSEDQIAEKLKISSCNPSDKRRLEGKYNKLKNALKKIQKMLAAAGLAIAGLSAILKMLNGLLKILDAIIKILNVILKVLKIIIKIAKIVVKFLGGTGTGGLIDLLSRLIVKADYKIKNWVQAVGRAKEFIKKMLKKYINPITRILDKAASIIAKVVGALEGLILILELIYMLALSKCTMSDEDGGTNADTNNKGEGTAGDGTGTEGGAGGVLGSGNKGGGLRGTGTKGDKMEALYRMLEETGSPEEVMARMVRMGGDDEYIRYIRNAQFETIGYERFNAAITSRDSTAGAEYPFIDSRKNKHINISMDIDDDLDFPDLVRGNAKNNILRKNLRINPKGPQPSDENTGSY